MSNGPAQPESDLDPTDPYARKAQTFSRLSEEMAARVVAYGTEERLPKGTLVFERGERSGLLLRARWRYRDLRPR